MSVFIAIRIVPLGLLLLLPGCQPGRDQPQQSSGMPDTMPVPTLPSEDSGAVSTSGMGRFRIGMDITEALPYLSVDVDTVGLRERCDYLRPPAGPDSVLFMFERGALVRIDVIGGKVTTPEGAKVGDPEERVMELYPNARRSPHKYTDGAYLTAPAAEDSDPARLYVFETDGQRVTRYRAGVVPAVEYVEGCA